MEKEKRRAAAKAAAEYEKAKKNQGWVSWMLGGPAKPAAMQSSSGEESADLSSEEIEKLQEIVSEQEKAVQQGKLQHMTSPCITLCMAAALCCSRTIDLEWKVHAVRATHDQICPSPVQDNTLAPHTSHAQFLGATSKKARGGTYLSSRGSEIILSTELHI